MKTRRYRILKRTQDASLIVLSLCALQLLFGNWRHPEIMDPLMLTLAALAGAAFLLTGHLGNREKESAS